MNAVDEIDIWVEQT